MTKRTTSITAGIFLFVLLVLHYIGWMTPFENAIQRITTPFIAGTHSINVKVGTSYELFQNRSNLENAYIACVSTTEANNVVIAKMKLLEQENAELRSELAFSTSTTSTVVVANVIGKEVLSPDQTILIDKGTHDAVKVGDPVVSGKGILVGKVVKVQPFQSMVRLINDSQSKVGALILNKSQSQGVVAGGYNISVIMSFIPRDEIVQKNDQVVTSGLEPGIPRGLLIGTISVVENEPYKPFQDAYVTPATNLSKLTVVSVLETHQ